MSAFNISNVTSAISGGRSSGNSNPASWPPVSLLPSDTTPGSNVAFTRPNKSVSSVPVTAGEPVRITCTYDPTLAQELPLLRKVPPHFVTWGDGSTDEMCVGVTWTSPKLPDTHATY